jgi:hypothetical protein
MDGASENQTWPSANYEDAERRENANRRTHEWNSKRSIPATIASLSQTFLHFHRRSIDGFATLQSAQETLRLMSYSDSGGAVHRGPRQASTLGIATKTCGLKCRM